MSVINVFINPDERRLRMVWRLALQTLIYVVLVFGFNFLVGVVGAIVLMASGTSMNPQDLTLALTSSPVITALGGIGTLLATGFSVWLAARFFDKRPLRDFGLQLDKQWWRDLAFGLALGALLMALVFVVELAAGWITITDTFYTPLSLPFGLHILVYVVLFLCVGIYEEVLSRGYHITTVSQGLANTFKEPLIGLFVAYFLSSAVFGLLHAGNPNASLVSTIAIVVAGLFLLGLGYVLTGRLGISIGVHITWNFFQGNVFGFPVSGITNMPTFIAIQQGGDPLFTGGAFGPEAGLIGIFAMLLGALITALYVRWQYGKVSMALAIAEPPKPVTLPTMPGDDVIETPLTDTE